MFMKTLISNLSIALALSAMPSAAFADDADLAALRAKFARPAAVAHSTTSAAAAERIALGQQLFFERRPTLDPNIHRLELSSGEKTDLLAFLATLTGERSQVVLTSLPR